MGHRGGSDCAASAHFVTPPTESRVRGHTFKEVLHSSYARDIDTDVPSMADRIQKYRFGSMIELDN